MTVAVQRGRTREWLDSFPDEELEAVRTRLPEAIHSAQVRSASAYDGYADAEEGKYVYGAGMLRGVVKDARDLLRDVSTYREGTIANSTRKAMYLGTKMIFPIRVGEKMRRNISQLRLDSFSEARREQLSAASSTRENHTSLFELAESDTGTDVATITDLLDHVQDQGDRAELFVVFFSSDHRGVGQMYWAPARLEGRYLEFVNPEMLTYVKLPERAIESNGKPQAATGFADSPRPSTTVQRRKKPMPPSESQ